MSCLRSLFCALATISVALNVSAQQITGSIRGSVSDPSGAVLQAATVTVKQTETGLTRTAASAHDGSYLLLELPVGHYSVEVTAQGFHKYVQTGISLNVNETAIVAVRLAVGAETQQVEVSADAQLIESSVSSLGVAVLEREFLDLPLDGRNFSQLGLLQPGVVPLTAGLREAGGSLRDGQAYSVNGQRPESNNFLIDGANNVNSVDAGFVLKPPIDAISEFRILTHNANAEFGQNTGSTTNIITRAGTNSFHGALWEFLRNDAMDASDFSAHAVQPLKRNQFGATFGGPMVKDKTFFFGYYEGFRNRQGETVPATVPSSLERQGNFSEKCSEGFDPNTNLCRNPDPSHQLYNFLAGPIPGNQLSSIDPIAANILKFYPLPNQGASQPNTFITTRTRSVNNDQFGLCSSSVTKGATSCKDPDTQIGIFPQSRISRGRGKGIPVPGRAVQFPEPHQFATPQQRYNVADIRRNPL